MFSNVSKINFKSCFKTHVFKQQTNFIVIFVALLSSNEIKTDAKSKSPPRDKATAAHHHHHHAKRADSAPNIKSTKSRSSKSARGR